MADGDLITLEAAKAWLGIADDSQDADLSRLITAYSAIVERFVNRTLNAGPVTETRHGTGGTVLVTRNWPILSVSAVTINGRPIPPAPPVGGAGYLHDEQAIHLRGHRFDRGVLNVSVTMTAGYDPIPHEIQQAMLFALQAALGQRERDPNVTSESLPGVSSTSLAPAGSLPAVATDLLQPFKRLFG